MFSRFVLRSFIDEDLYVISFFFKKEKILRKREEEFNRRFLLKTVFFFFLGRFQCWGRIYVPGSVASFA